MLAALALSYVGLFMGARALNAPYKFAPAHLTLLALLENPRNAYKIGLAYLSILSPDERSAGYLVKKTFNSLSLSTQTPPRPRMIGRLVNDQIRREFAEGAVVTVDRWILSVTEARLYALAALA